MFKKMLSARGMGQVLSVFAALIVMIIVFALINSVRTAFFFCPKLHPSCKIKLQISCVLRSILSILRECCFFAQIPLTGAIQRAIMNT